VERVWFGGGSAPKPEIQNATAPKRRRTRGRTPWRRALASVERTNAPSSASRRAADSTGTDSTLTPTSPRSSVGHVRL